MAVTVDQVMDELNLDDDEREKIELALKQATSYVYLSVYGNDTGNVSDDTFNDQRNDIVDRLIFQTTANFYSHPTGDAKQNATSPASSGTMLNYIREPSV